MRVLAAFSLILVLAPVTVVAPQGDQREELCVARIVTPQLHHLFRARLTEQPRATFSLDSNCRPENVVIDDTNALMAGILRESVKQWEFCRCKAGQRVTITFRFGLEGPATDNWSPTRIRFLQPGVVEFSTSPPDLQP